MPSGSLHSLLTVTRRSIGHCDILAHCCALSLPINRCRAPETRFISASLRACWQINAARRKAVRKNHYVEQNNDAARRRKSEQPADRADGPLGRPRPSISNAPPKATPRKKPETLAEENARLRARVAELEAVASMAGPARRCEAAQLDLSSAAEPIRQRLEQQRTTILRLEALVERQAKALDATDADGAATEELLDRLARALRGVAELGRRGAVPHRGVQGDAS